jgi:hypothetical protein
MQLGNVTTDAAKDYGITFARQQYVASLPEQVVDGENVEQVQVGTDDQGNPIMEERRTPRMVPNPARGMSDAAYLLARIGTMIDSWAEQADMVSPPPAPPPGTINGVPQELRKWQVLVGLGRDGIRGPVLAFIGTLSQAAQDLWNESTAVDRGSPLFDIAKAKLGWTDAQIDDMFVRYSAITVADVTA